MRWWRKYRDLIEFAGIVIVWPALVYILIFGIDNYSGGFGVRAEGAHEAATLAIVGLAAWVAIKVRRGGS